VFDQTNFSDGTTSVTVCNFYYFNANSERSAYGNHCWAQSNLRTFLNGPFNTATEFLPPPEKRFYPGRPYYARKGGRIELLQAVQGYTTSTNDKTEVYPYYFEGRCTNYTDANISNEHYLGEDIAAWEQRNNAQVLVKYHGGLPVGCKYDRYNYDRYYEYGLSPVQQYAYVDGTWQPQFNENDLWFHPQASINNGLGYDRLAGMFMSNAVWKGTDGSATLVKSPNTARTDGSSSTGAQPNSFVGTSTAAVAGSTTAKQSLPRQSFLHGFLDVKYKRTNDNTKNANKQYYCKTVYGKYIRVEDAYSQSDLNNNLPNPFAAAWYEENPNFLEDYKTAIEFLNVIVPVINCNGSFGTESGLDMYSRQQRLGGHYTNATTVDKTNPVSYNGHYISKSDKFKFGGTVCVDKVWLTSTGQIAGGDDSNCTTREQFNVTADPETPPLFTGATKYRTALKKWRDAYCMGGVNDSAGQSALNASRVKSGFTSGAHVSSSLAAGSGGYQDTISQPLYWWLRSAGGNGAGDKTGKGGGADKPLSVLWRVTGASTVDGSRWGSGTVYEWYYDAHNGGLVNLKTRLLSTKGGSSSSYLLPVRDTDVATQATGSADMAYYQRTWSVIFEMKLSEGDERTVVNLYCIYSMYNPGSTGYASMSTWPNAIDTVYQMLSKGGGWDAPSVGGNCLHTTLGWTIGQIYIYDITAANFYQNPGSTTSQFERPMRLSAAPQRSPPDNNNKK
jgi:hypothetical protein